VQQECRPARRHVATAPSGTSTTAKLQRPRYDGTPTDAVEVGTIKRAKGLEFKHVLVARVAPDLLAPTDAATDLSDVDRERRDRDRRSLCVAMTRARDELRLGVARLRRRESAVEKA
jgi:superfamily I DNA/RNA helicase